MRIETNVFFVTLLELLEAMVLEITLLPQTPEN